MKYTLLIVTLLSSFIGFSQEQEKDTTTVYKKRVLETTEISLLTSFYDQEGDNAATTGGVGSEELTDNHTKIIVSVPLNDDDVLTIDASLSSYTSASSSQVNPFDGEESAVDVFTASSGSSQKDSWKNGTVSYSHSSDDRNTIWSANFGLAKEYDYTSTGFGGSYTKLFNKKNTSLSINGNIFLDSWKPYLPIELRIFDESAIDKEDADQLFANSTITGAPYQRDFEGIEDNKRNTYSGGLGFSQILSTRLQGSVALDFIYQNGLLSTPFHRIYFADVSDSYIRGFQLADDIERLPDSRLKIAIGGRLNYYVNEFIVLRSFYRYYTDNWGITSHTASLEVPIKLGKKFTLYPSYRYYSQTEADYFAAREQHLSTSEFYTSDYDLSSFNSSQYGIGLTYTDLLGKIHFGKLHLKSADFKYTNYSRNTSFNSSLFSFGIKVLYGNGKKVKVNN